MIVHNLFARYKSLPDCPVAVESVLEKLEGETAPLKEHLFEREEAEELFFAAVRMQRPIDVIIGFGTQALRQNSSLKLPAVTRMIAATHDTSCPDAVFIAHIRNLAAIQSKIEGMSEFQGNFQTT